MVWSRWMETHLPETKVWDSKRVAGGPSIATSIRIYMIKANGHNAVMAKQLVTRMCVDGSHSAVGLGLTAQQGSGSCVISCTGPLLGV